MAVTEAAQRNHDRLFPNHVSTLKVTDPELIEIFDNWAFDEVIEAAEYFTGNVRIDMPFQRAGSSRVGGGIVTFEPGARSAWHTHPLGQTLIVTAGKGWTQCEGGPIVEINAGDMIWYPPGHKHWHGATPTTAMTHIAIQEALDGKAVEWLQKVTDAEYLAGPPA